MKGFTLIEALIFLAILGLISAILVAGCVKRETVKDCDNPGYFKKSAPRVMACLPRINNEDQLA